MPLMSAGQPFTLDTTEGRRLDGRVHLAKAAGPRPTIVICHGFKGFMDWGFFPHTADLLSERGFTVLRFNFSGSGMQPGEDRVTDLDAFREATRSRDLREVLQVLDNLDTIAPGRVDMDRVGLLGHSMGGGVAILAAAAPPWDEKLKALVTWAAVSTFERLSEEEIAAWRREGVFTVVNARTGQELPIGLAALDDLEAHEAELDILAAAQQRRAAWLIVHGDLDETVPIREARLLDQLAQEPRELHPVGRADHKFGIDHPLNGPTPELIEVLNATQTWFRRHL